MRPADRAAARATDERRGGGPSRRGARPPRLLALAPLLAVLAPGAAWAQLPDLVDLSAQYMPGAAIEDPRPVRAQVSSYEVNANVPIPLGERTFLIPGATYHVEAVSYAGTSPGFDELRAFHAVDVPVLFVQLLPHDWSLSLRVAPGLAGDFEAVDGGLVRVSALGLVTHTLSDKLVLGGGALASYSFGSFLPLPAAYVDWTPSPLFRVEAFLPGFAAVKLIFSDRVEVGLRADLAGNAYAVRDPRVRGAWPCAAQPADDPATEQDERAARPEECTDHIAYSVATAGVTLGVRAFASVWLNAQAGHSLFRRYEPMNDEDDGIPGGGQSIPNVLFFRAGVTWRIPKS
ncbi:DUF6268 family outer membrane beta-barrel protein [Sorangium atrum]|uniref:DUF6268 family outer membrane beta-barrel protein n=1 Tax=Sorangium atrum TaxID=2995308 RepID=A0ABT5BX85_9BACT|nr:DUF6268 family outer membrane beta-barrel protein [Sorangium aterium]MDC0678785.1 DUF6268 family outer membrane beta-barrel protein [Sorangium aterium]